jgi:hypothetical protein
LIYLLTLQQYKSAKVIITGKLLKNCARLNLNMVEGMVNRTGPVVQRWGSLTLGQPKIRSKLPDSLSINLEIFLQRSCQDR